MSLKEAYSMAHSAQCRLHMAASEPDRNLRFVVGHLMHYESLRLRIVEIEHDISKSQRAQAVAFKGTGHMEQMCSRGVQKKPSTGQLGAGRKSPPPQQLPVYDDDDDDELEDSDPWSGGDDDDDGDELGLQRFPSGSAKPPGKPTPGPEHAPDLEPDYGDYDEDEDEPVSPEEPDEETLANAMKSEGSEHFANLYEGIKKCPCHGQKDAPSFEKFWELPADKGQKEGVTRAVAQVWV